MADLDRDPEPEQDSVLMEEHERVVAHLRERIATLEYDISLLHNFSHAIVEAIGQKAAWEARAIDVANKWREKNAALTHELQLAQVGLTSGCGCPIGRCQKVKPDAGSCWFQWAESHVSRRQADRHIQELQTNGNHPSRFAQARREGKVAQRLASPEPEGG